AVALIDEWRRWRTAKSCGPGAATVASILPARAGTATVTTTPLTGESTYKPSNLRAGKAGMSRLYLSNPCALSCYHCTRCCGRSRRPAFPAPSSQEGADNLQNPGRDRAAGIIAVVPAKAGTHTPRRNLVCTMLAGFRSTTPIGGYGSRLAPGRVLRLRSRPL